MACLVQEIGLGGGEKNTIDAAAKNIGEDLICAKAETGQHLGQGVFQILHGGRARIES